MTEASNEVIQAILTADTLIAHFLGAAEGVRKSLGRDVVEYDVQLGEANRTYPVIWEHLDRARALLVSTRDMSAYDRIRAQAGSTALGISTDRSEIERTFTGTGFQESQTLSVTFNHAGARLAVEACGALKQALPDVNWAVLDAQTRAPAPDLQSGSQNKWGLAAIGVGIVLIVLRYVLR